MQSHIKHSLLFFMLLFHSLGPALLAADESSTKNTEMSSSQVGVELLGCGILYSVYVSKRFNLNWAVNLGASLLPIFNIFGEGRGTSSFSVYSGSVSFLLGDSNHLLEIIGGGILEDRNGMSFFTQLGIGYRYCPKKLGSFRMTLYILDRDYISLTPYPGVSFGHSF